MEFNKNEGYCEERYTESELAKGILIYLKEFYIGDFETDGKTIVAMFENGQRFVLQITEL